MADEHTNTDGPDMNAIVHAVEDDPRPEVALDRIAQAVAAEPAGGVRKSRNRGSGKAAAAPPVADTVNTTEAPPARQDTPSAPINAIEQEPDMTEETTINSAAQTDTLNAFATDAQERLQAFYSRSTGLLGEMGDLGRGNMEAVVESSRILAAGLQDIGRTTLEETRTAYQGLTEDVKRMAGVKSPTEMLQLQSEWARRSFDALVAQTSRNAETMLKLANDTVAPLSSRVSVTVEKLSKAA